MVFLLQCPRLPMNIHHWTHHCKMWPLAFAQTPSHSASWALIKQTHCCIHHDPLSMHIITCSLPLTLWIVFFLIHSPSILTSACIDLNPISSKTSPASLRWPASSSSLHFCLFVSLCCVIKRICATRVAERGWGGWRGEKKERVRKRMAGKWLWKGWRIWAGALKGKEKKCYFPHISESLYLNILWNNLPNMHHVF